MSLSNDIIYPANKLPIYSKKDLFSKKPSNIINLILPGYQKGSSIFKLNEKIIPKLFLSKKGYSWKNLNLKHRTSILKSNTTNFYTKDKIIIKSNSENKINIIRKKNNSFCVPHETKGILIESLKKNNSKKEIFTKLKLNIKNIKGLSSSRNKSYRGISDELLYENKNSNNSNQSMYKKNKKIKKSIPYLLKNKSTFIPKAKTKINLTLSGNQKKNTNYFSKKYNLLENKLQAKNNTSRNIPTNINDKENINLTNLNESNINESLILSKLNITKKKINLPFSPTSNKDKFYRQIKYKKCYIRNSKNVVPYNKKNKLTRQSSFYNLNFSNFKNSQNKIVNNNTREDGNYSLADIELYKKNNSISSFDLPTKTNSYSYANNELYIISNENNFEYKVNYKNYDVEMNHFRIVKIIQENKRMLKKNEKNI